MVTNTLIASFVPTGCNVTLERQYLKIVTDYSITVSGTTATATLTSTMYVHRDDRYPESTNKVASECYISIDGTKEYVVANGTVLPGISSDYIQVGTPVTHTVTYDAATSKTVEIGAHFNVTETPHKLNNLVIPVSSYEGVEAQIDSGSTALTFPIQTTACTAPTTFTASPSVLYQKWLVTLSWEGATGGISNDITGYEIQYATSKDGISWSDWLELEWTALSGTSTVDLPGIARGEHIKYRIRTQGSAGSSYYSDWIESNAAQKDNEPYVYLHGDGYEKHLAYIHDGREWGKYMPYKHDGTSWNRIS